MCQEELLSSDNNPFPSCLELQAQVLGHSPAAVSCPGLLGNPACTKTSELGRPVLKKGSTSLEFWDLGGDKAYFGYHSNISALWVCLLPAGLASKNSFPHLAALA